MSRLDPPVLLVLAFYPDGETLHIQNSVSLIIMGFKIFFGFGFIKGFKQYAPPTDLPIKVRQAIMELENKSHDQMSYLQVVYDFVTDKTINQWKHTRFKSATKFTRGFINDLEEIWETEGFIYCTAINFVSYTLIANSKFFKIDDVKVRHVFLNFITHQYLQIRVGDKWIDFDPAGSGIRGRNLGTHASIFG